MTHSKQLHLIILSTTLSLVVGCGDRPADDSVCSYNGKTYVTGESFPAADGCNSCSCNPGGVQGVSCTSKGCGGVVGQESCSYNGNTYKSGEHFPAADGCNSCTCNPEGAIGVGCTSKSCPDSGVGDGSA